MSGGRQLRIVPANASSCSDLQVIFGTRGQGYRCQCQRYKLAPGESFAAVPVDVRADRLRNQTECDNPEADRTSGLVAYLSEEPVGWCAVEPRPMYDGLVRVMKVPWQGRNEDRSDRSVWAATCLFVRAGFRRQGISRALAAAAVEHARASAAVALEAYPMTTSEAIAEELHVGAVSTFAAAGLVVVTRPTQRRVVMRIDL